MAVQDQEGAAGYSGPREQVHRQTLQETVCAQAQGRAGGHRGTSATCGCSFFVPSPAPRLLLLQRLRLSESSDGEPTAVQGPVGTGRARGACTAEPRVPAGKPCSVVSGPTWHQAEAVSLWQGHGIARWLGSWAFLPAPAKAGLPNRVAERQLCRGQGESLLGKLGSSPSPHGLQVC